ncbi:MAG: discoidin domain-containing protein [Verrucomicrobia bacterium]|nr:discoidin domain-containing protein [Verrucomicrobiota bacterium]
MLKRVLPRIVLIALLVGGAALRLSSVPRATPLVDDYGTVGLMSKHILEGRDFPLYFYGFDYMGALAAYVGAGAFALLGESFASLCAAMIPFSTLWILATYLLFRRLVGEWAGVIAAAVVAFPPILVAWYSAVPLLGYPTTFAYGTTILYLGVRLNDPDLTPKAEWFSLVGLGALAGIAIWTNPLCIAYLVVGFGLLVAHVVRSHVSRRLVIKLGVAFLALLAALTPVVVTAHKHGLSSLFGHGSLELSRATDGARAVATRGLPRLLQSAQMPWTVGLLVDVVYVLLGACLIAGFVAALVRRNTRVIRAALVPVLFGAVFLLLVILNRNSSSLQTRYLTPFYLVVAACFAFPLVYRRRWISAATALLAIAVIGHNIADVACLVHGEQVQVARRHDAELEQVVRLVETKGLKHVMVTIGHCPGHYAQALTFVARERVVFAFTSKEYYYPYAVSAAADDHAGFMQAPGAKEGFTDTLRCLRINSFESFRAGDAHGTVFHDLELPDEQLSPVVPVKAVLAGPDGPTEDAAGLIDRDDETVVGAWFDTDTGIVVDFREPRRIAAARFVGPDERDYPIGYTLSASNDGADWTELQRVDCREAQACIYGNRLCCGNRFDAMELRFEPMEARYLKLGGFRRASPGFNTWRFQEAYFYERIDGGGRPDKAEAVEIARELERGGVDLAVCDEWLSRKIEQMPGPRPGVLPRWEFRFPESQVSRVVPVRLGVAIVVETPHADEANALLARATLGEATVARHDFAHYTALTIEEAPPDYESFPGLRWNGFILNRTARIASAEWYHRRGVHLEKAGDPAKAMDYLRRSFETFAGIPANLSELAEHDPDARTKLAELTPAVRTPVRFSDGVSLVGYTLTPSSLVPGEPARLQLVWQLEGRVKHDYLQVFVHFRDDRRRAFQVDHNAVFPVEPGASVPRALVLDEQEFTVPDAAPPGELAIYLGATIASDRSVRLDPSTKLPVWNRAVEIGRVHVRE